VASQFAPAFAPAPRPRLDRVRFDRRFPLPFLCRNAATGESAWVRPSPMPPGEPPVPPMPPVEFRINVKLPNKKVIVVEVSSSDLPWQVRKRAEPIACMGSLDETTLVYGVEEMEETLCLAVYEVVADSTIRIVSKPQSQATGDEKSTGNPGNPVGVVAAAKSVTGPCPLCNGDLMRQNPWGCKGDHHDPRLHAAAVPSIPMSPRGLGQPPHQFRGMSPRGAAGRNSHNGTYRRSRGREEAGGGDAVLVTHCGHHRPVLADQQLYFSALLFRKRHLS